VAVVVSGGNVDDQVWKAIVGEGAIGLERSSTHNSLS
jgi:hypothetical protein